jgi:FMN reductase
VSSKSNRKYVVGLGGTLRPNSTTERAIRQVLTHAESQGALTDMFAGEDLNLPMYMPGAVEHTPASDRLIEALRRADAVVIGSPGYHGGISGLVKNALDYTEEMAGDPEPYFTGRAIGCIATGAGWQGANSTLQGLRSVAHALRGWPTSLGVAINSQAQPFDARGECVQAEVAEQLRMMARQLTGFARVAL